MSRPSPSPSPSPTISPASCPAISLLLSLLLPIACTTTAHGTREGPAIEIPRFAKDDARVGKAGFVAETLRLGREVAGTTYTLMAFVVGDTLTLGAMVKGTFRGVVHFTIGARELRLPFDAAAPGKPATVTVTGSDAAVKAEGAGFRGTSWTNIELPCAEWLPAGTPLQLEFVPEAGAPVTLPDAGFHYTARFVAR